MRFLVLVTSNAIIREKNMGERTGLVQWECGRVKKIEVTLGHGKFEVKHLEMFRKQLT